MNAFTIKDLENLSGIKAHTIRIWEQRYAFLKPQRTETNIRYYSNEELKIILNVALLNKYGFKISHIDKMKNGDLMEKIMGLNQIQAQHERIVNEMVTCMVDLDIDQLELILDEYIAARGIEKTITQIIFPFLEKIGILWITNHINPAQEHLVTNVIRQKLIVGIESAKSVVTINKTLLLFLPEGEHHELGLLFIYYLLKSKGVKVWYLGANVPVKDLDFVIRAKKPDYVYTHLTSVAHNFNFEKFLNKLSLLSPSLPIIVSGLMTQQYKKKVPANINFKTSLPEVMEYVASL
jgi:MerR family transcriptional regulator, light-induced transcriptional regulator